MQCPERVLLKIVVCFLKFIIDYQLVIQITIYEKNAKVYIWRLTTLNVIGWFKLQLWKWLVDLNYNFECDWLIELSDKNLASEFVEIRSFLNQSQFRELLLHLVKNVWVITEWWRWWSQNQLWPRLCNIMVNNVEKKIRECFYFFNCQLYFVEIHA